MTMPANASIARRLWHLAWPVLIAQSAVMANGVIDTVMAGRISAVDLAAVGIGAAIYASVFVCAMGVLLALPITVAHHYGAGRHAEVGAEVRQSVWLALALAAGAALLLKHPGPFLALAHPPPAVEAEVRAYLDGSAWAVPSVLLFRVFHGLTTGIARPRPVMVFNLLGLALKVPLNAIFMYGALGFPAMGGAGASRATALIGFLVAAGAWTWCRKNDAYEPYAVFTQFEPPRWRLIAAQLRLGLPIGGTFLVDVTAFTFMALFIARLGAETSAAHQIAASVAIFVFAAPISLGHATGVLIGHALGAGEAATARATGFVALRVGLAIGAAIGLAIGLGAPALAAAYSADPGVRPLAAGLLGIVALYHVVDALQAVMAQVLRGYKRASAPMLIYAVALWGVGLAGGYALGLTDWLGPPRGAQGFWIASTASLLLAGVALVTYFERVSRHPAALPRPQAE